MASPVEHKQVKTIKKIGASGLQNEVIQYTYERCGVECVYTFEAESGWIFDRVSKPNRNGTRDRGVCQLNEKYHMLFIRSEAFKDPYKQLDYCISVWNDAVKKKRLRTTFYAYNVIHKRPGVKDRFIITYQ